MSKLDSYLRSIEKFAATGAVLASNQPVLLRFPTGDRSATQVTPHDQLVVIVREVAPPAALDQIDKHRPARFELDSNGTRYTIDVAPRPGAWTVSITTGGEPSPRATPAPTMTRPGSAAPVRPAPVGEVTIERTQYEAPSDPVAREAASASALLDQITHAARAARASDVYLCAGASPLQRVAGELAEAGAIVDGDVMSRELGVVAPAEARGAWAAGGTAVFAYGDGGGRVRVALGRDQRGPLAAMRLLPDDPPSLDRLGLGDANSWLVARGLVLVAGSSGVGKTVTLAALVRALAQHHRRVVTIEDPIEIVHASPLVSQRALGVHVASYGAGVAAAMREGADAIVLGAIDSDDAASALVDAVGGGHVVLATVVAPTAAVAIDRVVDRLPVEHREHGRGILETGLLGLVRPIVARGGARSFEVLARENRV